MKRKTQELERRLVLKHQMRESGKHIEVLARNSTNGNILTIDAAAIRLWGPKKQLKSHHLPASYEATLRPIFAVYSHKYDRYIVLWSVKKQIKDDSDDEDGDEESQIRRGGVIQVWDNNLILEQEEPIMLLEVKNFDVCMERLQFAVIDIENRCTLLQIDHLFVKKGTSAHYQGDKGYAKGVGKEDTLKLKLYFSEVQEFIIDKSEGQCVDVFFLDQGDSMYLMTFSAVSRYEARVSYKHGESQTSLFENVSVSSPSKSEAIKFDDGEDLEVNGYTRSHRFFLPYRNEGVRPVSVLGLGQSRFAISMSNGFVEVRHIDISRNYENNLDAHSTVMAAVEAHPSHDPDDGGKNVTLGSCEGWSTVAPGGHEFEFITIGSKKIKLWGLRSLSPLNNIGENDFSSVYSTTPGGGGSDIEDMSANDHQYTSVLDLLGATATVAEPPSKVITTGRRPKAFRPGKSRLVTFELQSRATSPDFAVPLRRQFVTYFGGMVAFVEAYQIHRIVTAAPLKRSKKEFVAFNHGPPLALLGSPDPTGHFQDSILTVDNDDLVGVVDPASGSMLRQFDALYVADTRKLSSNRVGDDSRFYREVKAKEGKPTCVYWCPLLTTIFVGYSSGGVAPVDSELNFQEHTDTTSVHDAAIKQIYTFRMQPNHDTLNDFMMVGDAKGRLSVWQLSGTAKRRKCIWTTDAHIGSVVCIVGLLTSGDLRGNSSTDTSVKRVILTACTGGIVKVWLQHDSGELLLSSFFKTLQGGVSSLHASFVVTAVEPGEGYESSVEKSGSQTLQSQVLRSVDGSHQSATQGHNKKLAHIICVCGLSNGVLECWVLSNSDMGIGNNSYVMDSQSMLSVMPEQTPQWVLPCHESPIISVVRLRNSFEDLLHSSNFVYLATSGAGSALVLYLSHQGALMKQRGYFSLPSKVLGLLSCSYRHKEDFDEYLAVGEIGIAEISTSLDVSISSRWATLRSGLRENMVSRESSPKILNRTESVDVRDRDDEGEGDEEGSRLTDTISEVKEEDIAQGVEEIKETEADANLKSEPSLEERSTQGSIGSNPRVPDERAYLQSESGTLYAESLDSMDREGLMSADLAIVKKDTRLTDLFRQAEKNDRAHVNVDTAIDIILTWINTEEDREAIEPTSVWETMLLLDIDREDYLSYLKVAKVATLVARVAKKQLKASLAKLGISELRDQTFSQYKKLKSVRANVTYNPLGEMSVEKVTMDDKVTTGRPKGREAKWDTQTSKVMDAHSSTSILQPTPTRLQTLPPIFEEHFRSKFLTKVELARTWDNKNPHWIDQRRAIRVARTLLDIRCTKQHELIFSVAQGKGSATTVEGLPRLLILYFERMFGHARLNVSHHKIVHFLEACLQYTACPVINFLQLYLCPETPLDEPSDLSLWVYVEMRHFLMSNQLVIDGSVIGAGEIPGFVDMDMGGATEPGSHKDKVMLRWQLVTRDNAKLAVDEMFRKRGLFGHECTKRLLEAVDTIPSTDASRGSENKEDTIDMEGFLYVAVYEFSQIEHLLKELDQILFSLKQFPPFRITTKRDIYSELAEKVPIDVPVRNANISLSLDRIRALLLQFVYNDARRIGVIDQITFRSVVVVAGRAILSFNGGKEAHRLVDEAIRLFRDISAPNHTICYADFIAALISHLVMNQGGTCGLDGAEAMDALKSMGGIGLGEKQASALVMMISLMQCPNDTLPFWTAGQNKFDNANLGKEKRSIDKSGMWSLRDKALPLDQALSAQSVDGSDISAYSVVSEQPDSDFPGMEVKHMKLAGADMSFSYLPETNRSMISSVSQEVVHLGSHGKPTYRKSAPELPPQQYSAKQTASLKREPSLLSQSLLSLDALDPLSAKDGGYNAVVENSYSHAIKRVDVSRNNKMASSRKLNRTRSDVAISEQGLEDDHVSLTSELSGLEFETEQQLGHIAYTGAHGFEVQGEDSYKSNRAGALPTRTAQGSAKQLRSGQSMSPANKSFDDSIAKSVNSPLHQLAQDEVELMHQLQGEEEQEMARMLELEAERFSRKRQQVVSSKKREQASARRKERTSMKYKAREDQARYDRQARGKALHEKALKQQEEDMNKKYAAIIKRQQEEKERVRLVKEARRAKELEAKEKENEAQEGILMRAKDRESADYEAAMKKKDEEERVKREAEAAKREKEEAAKRERERIAEEAREAAARMAAEKAAEEARELEEVNRRREEKLLKEEDVNILLLPTEEELAAQQEEERLRRIEEEEAEAAKAAAEAARAASRAKSRSKSRGGSSSSSLRISTRGSSRASSRRSERPPSVGLGGLEGDIEVGDWNSSDEEPEEPVDLTPLEQRMVHFLERMHVAGQRNAEHPRKGENKLEYFMPMLFSDDIKYKNFETPVDDERVVDWKPRDLGKKHKKEANPVNNDVVDPPNQFSDIAEAVKEHKIKTVQDRLNSLYKTSATEESPAEWTYVVKKDAVMWVEFLDAQEAILMERPPTPPPPVDEEAEFFKELKMNALFLKDVPDDEEVTVPEGVPDSMPVPSDTAIDSITPLPLGRVASGVVQPESYAYFQLELLDTSQITVELRSVRGYSDLYMSKNELPTKYNYEHRVQGGDYNFRTARLILEPKQSGTHYVGVHTEEGAKFDLWCFSAGAGAAVAKPLQAVTNKLRQWEIVSNHSVEEIDMKLPELMSQAKNIVDFENSMAKPAILDDYEKHLAEGNDMEEEDEDMDEIDIMDTFISKAGRRLIRNDLFAGACSVAKKEFEEDDSSDDEPDHIDPNSHPELFKKPELTSRRKYLGIIKAEPKLDEHEVNTYLTASMADRKKTLNMSSSLSSLPDLKKSLKTRSESTVFSSDENKRDFKLPPFLSASQKFRPTKYTVERRVHESKGDLVRRMRRLEALAKGETDKD